LTKKRGKRSPAAGAFEFLIFGISLNGDGRLTGMKISLAGLVWGRQGKNRVEW
jgi:hypothetical protein